MLKKLFVFLAIAFGIFLVLCWIYLPSVSRYRELRLEEEKITKRIREIDTQIKALSDERNLLQTDVAYLEKVIREELGFVKPGEIVYELVTKSGSKTPAQVPEVFSANGTASEPAAKGNVSSEADTPAKTQTAALPPKPKSLPLRRSGGL